MALALTKKKLGHKMLRNEDNENSIKIVTLSTK